MNLEFERIADTKRCFAYREKDGFNVLYLVKKRHPSAPAKLKVKIEFVTEKGDGWEQKVSEV